MSANRGTPLSSIMGWSKNEVDKLADRWITTVEQVIAIAATPGGAQSLARQVGVPDAKMQTLIEAAREVLPSALAATLSRPADATQYGLGALPTGSEEDPWPRRA